MHCERRMTEMFVMLDVDKFQKDSVMLDVLPSILCSLSDLVRAFRRASNPLAAYIMPLPWRALPLVLYPISPPGLLQGHDRTTRKALWSNFSRCSALEPQTSDAEALVHSFSMLRVGASQRINDHWQYLIRALVASYAYLAIIA